MVRITLNNGSFLDIERAAFVGKIVDCNGRACGGVTTYSFSEAEVNALDKVVELQKIFDAVLPPEMESMPNLEICDNSEQSADSE